MPRVYRTAIVILALLIFSSPTRVVPFVSADSVGSAVTWLITHQQPDGSYGSLTELQTAPAGYALWLKSGDSSNVLSAYNWLKNQMNNSTSWFWSPSFAEADVPGEVLYSFDVSQHVQMLNLSFVGPKLLNFQQSNGGFKGYNPSGQQVTSSVDTAMALWGLINARAIQASNQQSAINYLLSLQNIDGSFNLTRTVAYDQLYSLGPEPASITALVSLVLKNAPFTADDPHVSSALNYLSVAAGNNFSGHVYAASLSALAFNAFSRPTDASKAIDFVLTHQNPDGGFRDISRSSTGSNALDTGWAAVALQLVTRNLSVKTIQIPRFIYRGQTISVKVNVTNTGQTTESFSLKLDYNGTIIATVGVVSLPPGSTRTISIPWNTTATLPSACQLTADIPALIGETNVTDNSSSQLYSYSSCVRKTGDVNGDRLVDLNDLISTWLHQFATDSAVIPQYDINADGAVDLTDLILVYTHMFT